MKKVKQFSKEGCAPCKAIAPTLSLLEEAGLIELEYIDVEVPSNSEYLTKYNVRGVPTLICEGKTLVGLKSEREIKETFGL